MNLWVGSSIDYKLCIRKHKHEAAQSIPTWTAELRVQIHMDTESASGELNIVRPLGFCAIYISFKNLLQVVGNQSLL